MSTKQPSNKELAIKIDQLTSEQKEVRKEMREFRDFMIVQLDRQKYKTATGTFDWQGVIKQVITALVIALGILGVVIQGLNR
jgi:hypothetical protein